FLDQDGIPTLVEVKRSTDTRIRREVVGQMLDYAANAVVYWSVEKIQSELERQQGGGDLESNPVLLDFLGPDVEQDDFWEKVKTNLQAGRVRLVFVADVIPTELKRIVEFLNGQMDPAEVLAVEIRQFQGGGQTALVPRVIGQTVEAERKKRVSQPRRSQPWDRKSFLEKIRSSSHLEDGKLCVEIFDWAEKNGLGVEGGTGPQVGSVYFTLDHHGKTVKPISLYEGYQFAFVYLSFHGLESLVDRSGDNILDDLENAGFTTKDDPKSFRIPFNEIKTDEDARRLFESLDFVIDRVKSLEG
ncbi:MAG: hypothetical protein KC978_24510, partial [Candidatus Omnitrophica bacterium]|nr:hypothetical protein [Candidatus Omnitrophota bacterium]